MKRTLGILGLILVIGIGSALVYADGPMGHRFDRGYMNENYEDLEEWHKANAEYRKEMVREEVEKGNITEEEAKEWEKHHEYMEEFHNEYGFGGCHGGRGPAMMRRGYGGRHHRGWNW